MTPIKCQWHGCQKEAAVKILRADTFVCDDHYEVNVLQFGCFLSFEKIKKEERSVEA